MQNIFNPRSNQNFTISSNGLQTLLNRNNNPKYPGKNVVWTDDYKVQLPIRKVNQGIGAVQPTTLIDQFIKSKQIYKNKPALSVKRNGKWKTINFFQYYNQCIKFASSMIANNFPQFTSVNIIGFNSPQWAISFYGGLFARAIITGIYTTNSIQVCQYICQNSDCQVLIAQNSAYLKKYQNAIKLNKIKLVVVYNDQKADFSSYNSKVIHWSQFMKHGQKIQFKHVQQRMKSSKPGNCATLIYTSGTTGLPKGVMLSHDNLIWTKRAMDQYQPRQGMQIRMVSYLPLSHVAGLYADLVTPLMSGYHIYFAQPDALQGSLIDTLKQVKPNAFFSVPRVWEKIYQKMKLIAKNNGYVATKIADWAKSIGPQGTIQQINNKQTSLQFKIAKTLIFNQIKKQLGFEECTYFLYGSAPLDPQIRKYFLSLNFFLINSYGMSQSTGPQNFSNKQAFDYKNLAYLKQVGSNLPGTQIIIKKNNQKDEDGQICYRGRNIFMGYYKNAQQTSKVFDQDGYLHSGDLGKLNKQNVLFITGRAKQLIITAGGQNIPPVIIQDNIKQFTPFLSNVMVVGQGRKYLTCLVSLKQQPVGSGKLQTNCKDGLKNLGIQVNTVQECIKHPNIKNVLMQCINKANQKAISRAQKVQNVYLINEDFSVQNGTLTPTLKIKRKQVSKKYSKQIQSMYLNAKL